MSRFSSVSDLKDHIEINGLENTMKSKIYVGDKLLDVKEPKDLIPYYPHTIAMAVCKNGIGDIYLSKRSYVDVAEEDSLTLYLETMIREYERCKRKNIEFMYDNVEMVLGCHYEEQKKELFERVKEYGDKATIKGIHLPYKERLKKDLADEMLKHGLNPADYGYERFV